jgi:hypothetical protein
VIISLHVDDTLATGEKWALEELHKDLEKHFGTMKAEKNKFRHFGVDISRNEETLDVQMCQKSYIANLKPISRKKEKGRTVECDSNPQEVTDFRSLVSGIAWVGITSPGAQAVASLMQGFLPIPKLKHLDMANAALQQLIDEYVPLVFRFGFDLSSSKLLLQTDSSLGNNQKYSQGGFVLFLCENDPQKLAGHVNLIGFRSGKSKRVANSTSAAETLVPPLWAGDDDEQYCIICKFSFAFLRKGHHCRNCGYLVCHNCSSKTWPSEMLPSTYHFNEKYCRVCDVCKHAYMACNVYWLGNISYSKGSRITTAHQLIFTSKIRDCK